MRVRLKLAVESKERHDLEKQRIKLFELVHLNEKERRARMEQFERVGVGTIRLSYTQLVCCFLLTSCVVPLCKPFVSSSNFTCSNTQEEAERLRMEEEMRKMKELRVQEELERLLERSKQRQEEDRLRAERQARYRGRTI